jgi:hypothetical protein
MTALFFFRNSSLEIPRIRKNIPGTQRELRRNPPFAVVSKTSNAFLDDDAPRVRPKFEFTAKRAFTRRSPPERVSKGMRRTSALADMLLEFPWSTSIAGLIALTLNLSVLGRQSFSCHKLVA